MTIIAAIGVVVGSAALLVVLSGFAGLKDFSLQFSSIVDPDLTITPRTGKTIRLKSNALAQVNEINSVVSYSKIVEERAVLVSDNKRQIITLKGVDSLYPQNTINSITSLGSWMTPGSRQIVAGWGVASNLSFGVMDYGKILKLYTPKPGKGQITSEKEAFNKISTANIGIFEINEDLDHDMVYADIDMVSALLNYPEDTVSSLELILNSDDSLNEVRDKLYGIFGNNITIKTKEQLNGALHKMLNTENLAVYLIFTLVLIIALFNVVGSIIMMILDKKNDITTLFNLGLTAKEIRQIFFFQGSIMSLLGGLIGIILAIMLVSLQKSFGLIMITSTLSYPVTLKIFNIIIVFITIATLGLLASKLASIRISKSLTRQ